jgi:hypothetical protein
MSRLAVEFRAPRAGDVDALLANLRPEDQAEVDALLGPGEIAKKLPDSVRDSILSWTVEADGEVVCMLGLTAVSLLGDHGVPWMLGTPLVDVHRRGLVRIAPSYIARMLAIYPTLLNAVDARNTKAIGWLRRVGFTLLPPQPLGVAGLPFHIFFMNRHV